MKLFILNIFSFLVLIHPSAHSSEAICYSQTAGPYWQLKIEKEQFIFSYFEGNYDFSYNMIIPDGEKQIYLHEPETYLTLTEKSCSIKYPKKTATYPKEVAFHFAGLATFYGCCDPLPLSK